MTDLDVAITVDENINIPYTTEADMRPSGSSNKIVYAAGEKTYIFPVVIGDKLSFSWVLPSGSYARCGFTTIYPVFDAAVTGYVANNAQTNSYNVTSEVNGYFVISTPSGKDFTSFSAKKELQNTIGRKVYDIEKDVDGLQDETAISGISVIEQGFGETFQQYVNEQGGFVNAEGWKRSDYIDILPGYSIEASLVGFTGVPIVAFYDSAKTYLSASSIMSNSQNVVSVQAVAPQNARYAIFVSQTSHTDAFYKVETIATIGEAVEKVVSETEVDSMIAVSGFGDDARAGYIDENGAFTSAASGWKTSQLIKTKPGVNCSASLMGYLNYPLVAFYDANMSYMGNVSVLSDSQRVVDIDIAVPEGAFYVAFVCQTYYTDGYYVVDTPANIGEAVDELYKIREPYKGLNVVCLGDSLTRGRDGQGNILVTNYPYYMKFGRLQGCHIENLGVVGSTAKSFWNNDLATLDVDENTDLVLAMWGTNGGFTSNTLATDVEPYDNYEDYANTGVGCMCKLIEYIMEQTQNKAQIILITPPYNDDASINERVIKAQSVVKAIAERYKIPCIDMFQSGISEFNASTYMPDDSVHFNAAGYEWIGKYIGSCVNAVCAK